MEYPQPYINIGVLTRSNKGAFNDCSKLTSVYYEGDIASWCNISFGDSCANPLYNAHNLYIDNELVTELVIPDTVTKIKPYAFYNCTNIASVTIPDTVTSIGDWAFGDCSSLTSVKIPNSVTSIGNYAFCGCVGLENIVIGNGVTSIGYNAFFGCDKLVNINYLGAIDDWCKIEGLDDLMIYSVSNKTFSLNGLPVGDKKEYTDLAVLNDDGEFIAIELKYKTDAAVINGVSLLRHSAGDLGCYDFWHDVERIQKLCGKSINNVLEGRKCVGGFALMMTNDSWYWNQQRKHSTAQYYPFRLVDREVTDKKLSWNLKVEDKEKFKQQQVNRYQDIELNLPYVLKWEEYYTDQKNCMKYLLLPVNKK